MMSTDSPSIFNMMNLYSGMSALNYAPRTSEMATSLPSCTLMLRMVNRDCKDMVGEDASYLCMWHIFGLPSAHVLPFSFPNLFYFIRFIDCSDPLFCDFVILSESSDPINLMYYSCMYYLYMAAIYI